MILKDNILLSTDSYKLTHWKMYPDGVKRVHSYFEARKGGKWDHTLFFGLQYFLKRHFEGVVVTEEMIDEARTLNDEHFGGIATFNEEGWRHVLDTHGGKLPVIIKAVPEGSLVPESNVLLTIENTDPECFWLTNHLETLLVQLWYPCTVATSSAFQYKALRDFARATGSNEEMLSIKLHDFGFRGAASYESAALGGAGHLIPFTGTDNLAAYRMLQQYYGAVGAPGNSIPAAEHSTVTTHESEEAAYKQVLDNYNVASVVSDSYDIDNAIANIWGGSLRQDVLRNAKEGGLLVIRPDSGDPVKSVLKTLNDVANAFGVVANQEGFKRLPDGLAVIQGDGISPDSLAKILGALQRARWSLDSIAFGSGGGLLQQVNRDTLRFAMKCSAAQLKDGTWRDVFKSPKTDRSKTSKRGRLTLVQNGADYKTVRKEESPGAWGGDMLKTVFQDGELHNETDLEAIRLRWTAHEATWA